jgi:hypothetical protein
MTASRKKKTHDIFGSKPLPAHFGEIDTKAPFDAERFYVAERSVGRNPLVIRQSDDSLSLQMYVGRDHEQSPLQRKRWAAALEWASQQDKDHSKRWEYIQRIANDLPFGGIAYLG